MVNVIHDYAHSGNRFSLVNRAMWQAAQAVDGVTRVDLYGEYPRHNVKVDREQQRLLDHDVIVLQFPIFWYSAPSLLKEWIDLTLEHGVAYGKGGDKLRGKWMMLAVTAAGPEAAYSDGGYQKFPLCTFLTPFEQTARLSKMRFVASYVLHDALKADPTAHAAGLHEARLLVVAIGQRDAATDLVRHVRHEHPKLGIVARAVDRHHVYELYAAGATHIVRDTFDSAVRAGRSAYEELGMHAFDAEMLARAFVEDDRAALVALASVYDPTVAAHENDEYLTKAKELAKQRDDILSGHGNAFHVRTDRGWTPPSREDLDAEQEADQT